MTIKRLQNFYLYGYRLTGFVFLVGLISSILWYGFSVLFFVSNSSWSVPYIISPNQENVLIHQERLLNMEHDLLQNTIELTTAKDQLKNKQQVLKNAQEVYSRIKESMSKQSTRDVKNGKIFNQLTHEQAQNVSELQKLLSNFKDKEAVIDKELKMGLITREEALSQRFLINSLRSSLIDAKARVQELKQRTTDYKIAASTLNGSSLDLTTMQKLVKTFDLSREIAQLKSDLFALKISIHHLKKNIAIKTKVLSLIKNSPYILATKNPVNVAFVPYSNLSRVKIGSPVYSCYLDILFCYKSGKVKQVYAAEEYGKHPIFKSDIKGQYIGVEFTDNTDAQNKLLFLNAKPLLI